MFKSNRMKFLTESILLEESGIPGLNSFIAISVAAFIVLFILWSNQVYMTESISLSGQINQEKQDGSYLVTTAILPADINQVKSDDQVTISISGITNDQKINGVIGEIDYDIQYTEEGSGYYVGQVLFTKDELQRLGYGQLILLGMDVTVNLETDKNTLLQYLLGNIYDSGKAAMEIQK